MADSTLLNLLEIDGASNDDFALIWDSSAVNENNNKKIKFERIAEYVGQVGQVDFNVTTNSKDIVVSAKKQLVDGLVLSLTFLTDILGSSADDFMTINYNLQGQKTIKVGKDGSLSDFKPVSISDSFKFLQAFTTLQCKYVEAQDCFLIVGNPVVLSDSSSTSGYTIYSDGTTVYPKNVVDSKFSSKEPFVIRLKYTSSTSGVLNDIANAIGPNSFANYTALITVSKSVSFASGTDGFITLLINYARNKYAHAQTIASSGMSLSAINQYSTFTISGATADSTVTAVVIGY